MKNMRVFSKSRMHQIKMKTLPCYVALKSHSIFSIKKDSTSNILRISVWGFVINLLPTDINYFYRTTTSNGYSQIASNYLNVTKCVTLQCWIEAMCQLFWTCLLIGSCHFHKYEPCVLFGLIDFYNEPRVLFGLCWVLSEPCVGEIPNSRRGSVH